MKNSVPGDEEGLQQKQGPTLCMSAELYVSRDWISESVVNPIVNEQGYNVQEQIVNFKTKQG